MAMQSLSFPRSLQLTVGGRFAVLRAPSYRRFWLAAVANDIASWLLFAAQGWLLLQLNHDPRMVVVFMVVRMGPKVLVGLPAGALCDRVGPLPVLRAARLAGAVPAVLIAAAALTDTLSTGVVLASAALASVVQAFDQPANRSLLYACAPGPLLVGGVAMNATAGTLATIAGPLLLAGIAGYHGVTWAFPAQALLPLLSAAVLAGMAAPGEPAQRRAADEQAAGAGIVSVLRYLAATPMIPALILLAGSPGMIDRLLAILTPEYAGAHNNGTGGLTLLYLAPAAGALLGGAVLASLHGVERLLPLAVGSSSLAFVSVGLLATVDTFALSLLLFVLLGAAKAAFSVTMMAALQRRVPDHARGRVLAL
jgi:hypothetical protein